MDTTRRGARAGGLFTFLDLPPPLVLQDRLVITIGVGDQCDLLADVNECARP